MGGGLAGSLTAWRIALAQPRVTVRLIEGEAQLGGNHTWSFHHTDLPASQRAWLAPLVVGHWTRHEVRFPGRTRQLAGGYCSITSDRLHDVIASVLGSRVMFGTRVTAVTLTSVTLASGEQLHARLVIDARGECDTATPMGWQCFVGQDLELHADHDLRWPRLMDATVPQHGGFRFVYVLPWTTRRVLVEDTLYADARHIELDDSRRRIADYVAAQGWSVRAVAREEHGMLPLPLGGSGEAFWPDDTPRIGVRAGMFHPTTGYSLPDAAATADLLAGLDLTDARLVFATLKQRALVAWRRRAFMRLLNRLLFRAAQPEQRVRVLEQFYRRPEALIARFYADRLTWVDRCRLLSGRPPVPVAKALPQLLGAHAR